MKKMKKLFAMILCMMMVLSMAAPVMAADTGYNITIESTSEGHVFEAYQIFSGTLSDDKTTLSNVVWGSSIKNGESLLAAIKTDTTEFLEGDNKTTLQNIFSAATDAAGVAKILGTVSNDSATLDRFAEVIGTVDYTTDDEGNITAANHLYLNKPINDATVDKNATSCELSNLPAGYYLIKDKELSQNDKAGFYTKYIIRVVKSDRVKVKGGDVTFDKSINDTLDGTFDNVEDFDINDTAYYKWTGTLPSNLRAYDSYWYKFTDAIPEGLTFKTIEAVYLEDHNGHVVGNLYENNEFSSGITFTKSADGKMISIEFDDLLKIHPALLSTHKVIVKYSCTVNRDALIALPNTNTAYLEYSNNPNGEGTGKTVEDYAHAFTFSFTVDKYDMADQDKKLENVKFRLYYREDNGSISNMYALVITEEMVEDGVKINGKTVTGDDVGVVYGWTAEEDKSSILDTDVNGAFAIKGLDEGTYFLKEIATVDGYNLLTTPVQIDIIPTYANKDRKDASVSVEYKVDSMSQGSSSTVGVRNSKGSTLPSTGGIGTTLFYVFGGVMVVGAVVLLVTKRRMSSEN